MENFSIQGEVLTRYCINQFIFSINLGDNIERESRLRDLEVLVEDLQKIVNRDKARLDLVELAVKEEKEDVGNNYESLVRKFVKKLIFISISLSQHRGVRRAEK